VGRKSGGGGDGGGGERAVVRSLVGFGCSFTEPPSERKSFVTWKKVPDWDRLLSEGTTHT